MGAKAARGMLWNTLETVGVSGVGFIVSILLARLLTPAEFGLVAMLQIFIAVSHVIVDSGMSQALIRSTGRTAAHESTVLLMNMGIAAALYLLFFCFAPLIAGFLHTPSLTGVIRLLTIVIPLNSLCVVQTSRLVSALQFRRIAFINCTAALLSGAAGIVLALFGFGVWALVWQQIAMWGGRAMLLWMVSPWRGRLIFDKDAFASMFGFSWKLLVSSLIDSIWDNIYPLIIGRFFNARLTGLYGRAQTFANYGPVTLSSMVSCVAYPVMCRLRDDRKRLHSAFRRLAGVVSWIVFPAIAWLIASSEPLFSLVLTDKWLPAVPYFRWLCAATSLYPLSALNLGTLKVAGRSDLFLRLELVKRAIGVIVLCATIPFGIDWMCIGLVVSSVLCFGLNAGCSRSFTGLRLSGQMRIMLPVIAAAALSGVAGYFAAGLAGSRWVQLVFATAAVFPVYMLMTFCLGWRYPRELMQVLRRIDKNENG